MLHCGSCFIVGHKAAGRYTGSCFIVGHKAAGRYTVDLVSLWDIKLLDVTLRDVMLFGGKLFYTL